MAGSIDVPLKQTTHQSAFAFVLFTQAVWKRRQMFKCPRRIVRYVFRRVYMPLLKGRWVPQGVLVSKSSMLSLRTPVPSVT